MNDPYSHGGFFNWKYVLIPVSIVKRWRITKNGNKVKYSCIYIFGVRIVYCTLTPRKLNN